MSKRSWIRNMSLLFKKVNGLSDVNRRTQWRLWVLLHFLASVLQKNNWTNNEVVPFGGTSSIKIWIRNGKNGMEIDDLPTNRINCWFTKWCWNVVGLHTVCGDSFENVCTHIEKRKTGQNVFQIFLFFATLQVAVIAATIVVHVPRYYILWM